MYNLASRNSIHIIGFKIFVRANQTSNIISLPILKFTPLDNMQDSSVAVRTTTQKITLAH